MEFIYSRGEGGTWASALTLFADREGRMSGRRAGCPVAREGPDVRAVGDGHAALWMGGVGCPAEGPDVRPLDNKSRQEIDLEGAN